MAQHEDEAQRHGGPFGDDGAEGNAIHGEAETRDEQHVQRQIGEVEIELEIKRDISALQADEPAEDGEVHQHGGRAPDADREIVPGQRFHPATGGKGLEDQPAERQLQKDHGRAYRHADEAGALDGGADLVRVLTAAGLGGERRCTHAQEAEDPVERGKDDGAERDGGDEIRFAQMADHRRIGNADEGDGGIGNDDRPRHRPDAGVGDGCQRRCARGRAGR